MNGKTGKKRKKCTAGFLLVLALLLGGSQVEMATAFAAPLQGGFPGQAFGGRKGGEIMVRRETFPIHTAMVTPYDEVMVQRICGERGPEEIHIVVSLKTRTLFLCSGNQIIDSFIGQVGANSQEGNKELSGDMRTPRGEYYVCLRNENSQYYRALGLSYPNGEDAWRGWEKGLISQEKRDEIIQAVSQGLCPDWGTPLGGAIEIHGEKGGMTEGCIALGNPAMDCLWPVIPIGCRVRIY